MVPITPLVKKNDAATYKLEVSEAVDSHKLKPNFVYFSSDVIQAALKKNSFPGADQIHSLLLKNLPIEYTRTFLYCLANRAIKTGIPKTWKEAKIIMISKKDGMCSDPEKYRPISLKSCLGKLVERLVKTRLYSFIERSGIGFDKVWHKGLIYKLIRMDIPSYIFNYIIDFLKDRTFKVSIGDTLSKNG